MNAASRHRAMTSLAGSHATAASRSSPGGAIDALAGRTGPLAPGSADSVLWAAFGGVGGRVVVQMKHGGSLLLRSI